MQIRQRRQPTLQTHYVSIRNIKQANQCEMSFEVKEE